VHQHDYDDVRRGQVLHLWSRSTHQTTIAGNSCWVATAYLLTSTLSVPIFASLSDIYGRKPFYLLGAVLFVVTSALCGAAGTLTFMPLDGMGQLILFRGLQGIGAGMVMGLLFTIVGDIFSPSERGRYVGLFSAVWGWRRSSARHWVGG
jgi:MFS family permease